MELLKLSRTFLLVKTRRSPRTVGVLLDVPQGFFEWVMVLGLLKMGLLWKALLFGRETQMLGST